MSRKKPGAFGIGATISVLILIVMPLVILTGISDSEALVMQAATVDTDNMDNTAQATRELYKNLVDEKSTKHHKLVLSEDEINSIIALAMRDIAGFKGRINITQIGIRGAFTFNVPSNPFGNYINLTATIDPSPKGLAVNNASIGNVEIPGEMAISLAETLLNQLPNGESFGTELIQSIQSIQVNNSQLTLVYNHIPSAKKVINNISRHVDDQAVHAGQKTARTDSADWVPAVNTVHSNNNTFAQSCAGAGVIGCRAFDSVSSMLEINDVGVPNSPNRPLTNRKCRWNGGSRNCFPVFDLGNCSLMDSLGSRSQDSFESAKRWSPCYDSNANAARLTFWNDRGSSVQLLNAVIANPQEALSQIWTQYEIMLSPEFFFSPEGTTSSKLYRIGRVKSAACKDKRFADHRFLKIYPDKVTIGPVIYCSGLGYAGSEANVTLDNARADHWIRITTHYDIANSIVNFWAYDVTTHELLSQKSSSTHRGVRFNFTEAAMKIKSLKFTHHSTSHDPNPAKPSPHYWLKNAILSRAPINPAPLEALAKQLKETTQLATAAKLQIK